MIHEPMTELLNERSIPRFPTVHELTEWFDRTNCHFGDVPAPALDYAGRRFYDEQLWKLKKDWLRQPDNESWYMTRLGLMVQAHEFCLDHHRAVCAGYEARVTELQGQLAKANEETAEAREGRRKAENVLVALFVHLKKLKGKWVAGWTADMRRLFPHLPFTKT